MTILAATDFSPCSLTAVRLAVAMARRHGAELTLLHTVEPVPVDPMAAPLIGGWEAELAKNAEEALEAQAVELRKSGLVVHVEVQIGSAVQRILDSAAASKPELIVIGTHGRRGAARLFVGSCAESVVRSATCPVLVTGADSTGLDRWDGTNPLSVAVVTDGSRASESVFSWVRTSGDCATNDVSLIRVYWPPQSAAHYGLDESWHDRDGSDELVRLLERDLRFDAKSLIGVHEPRMRFAAAWHDAGRVVAAEARSLAAEAVVIGVPAHRRGSTTGLTVAAVLRTSPVPVFCIPENAQPVERRIPKVRSVLIACDLSDASRAAILPGYGLLLGGGRVELLYVHARGTGNAVDGLPAIAALNADERAAIEVGLRAAVPPEAAEHGIVTHTSVVEGSLAPEAILQAAERLAVDVIVVGSHGRSGVRRAVLGSVAESVARQSTRPVLIVRGKAS
jgi:nucleotide-binding universal stress UspA family protein